MSYYNTTSESGQLLMEFKSMADINTGTVLWVFESYPETSFTPYEVGDILERSGFKMLQSSIKRSITDLTGQGKLINTGVKVTERYGKPNYKWKLND